LYNEKVVEYDTNDDLSSNALVSPALADDGSVVNASAMILTHEVEAVVQKELHGFTQKTLDDRGVYMLETGAEAFIWIGKKVQEKDRL
jgi:hypothetical protein